MKLNIKHILLWGSLVLTQGFISQTFAQSDINMTTHWYNRSQYNPANLGNKHFFRVFSNVRQQWIGVKGAPKVYNLSVTDYLAKYNSGIGISCMVDDIGVTRVINPMLSYAYHLRLNQTAALSFGISGGLFRRSIRGSEFEAVIENDDAVNYSNESVSKPDAHAGLEYSSRFLDVGVSSTHLFSGNNTDDYLNTNHQFAYLIVKDTRHQKLDYFIGAYGINRSNIFVYEGNVLLRLKRSLGTGKGYQETVDLGVSVRSSRQLAAIFSMRLSDSWRIGYAFEHNFIAAYGLNSTHEILVEFRLFRKEVHQCKGVPMVDYKKITGRK